LTDKFEEFLGPVLETASISFLMILPFGPEPFKFLKSIFRSKAIFFAKGEIETVKKLNWAPDVIHVHGWMASLFPLYLKEYFKDEPLFTDSKVITSIYSDGYEGSLGEGMIDKIKFDKIENDSLSLIKDSTYINLMKLAADNSDGVMFGSEDVNSELISYIENNETPTLDYKSPDEYESAYAEFYKSIMA
jgi:starch synthase